MERGHTSASSPSTAGGATYVVAPATPQPAPGHAVIVVPAPQAPSQPPPSPQVAVAPPASNGVVVCSGQQRLRIDERVIDGQEGAAIVATDHCVLEVRESIVRGAPAVYVSGNAQVSLVECRVEGDLRSAGAASIRTSGTAHRGRVLHDAF